ncbi:MAG: response regulator [Bryobacteraceae bacterium]
MSEPARVLVVDDEHAARYGILRALANQNYEVEEASNGVEALERIQHKPPDVVLSDINMPGMDGITLLRRTGELGDEAPLVVLITAHGSEGMAVEALRSGAHDYLAKPFELEELRAVVRNAVEKKRLLRENRLYLEQLHKTLEELRQSQLALIQSEKLASLSKLVAGIAHEINNPLGALSSNLDVIERGAIRLTEGTPDSTRIAESLKATAAVSRTACSRIAGIVTNLQKFAQLDRADWRRFPLRECIETTADLFRSQLEDTVELRVDAADSPEIEGRPRDLNQVWMHLLTNAREAVVESGKPGVIQLTVHPFPPGRVCVAVEDTGGGIPPEHLPRVFDPGFTTKGVGVGTGLGLAICLQVVKSHGGTIDVHSQPGRGARFSVVLPTHQNIP